jgi:dTDP-glucose pyrophosphorylase
VSAPDGVPEVDPGTGLAAALAALAAGRCAVAVVRGPDGALLGTVADGDLRAAALAGADHDAPVAGLVSPTPLWCSAATTDDQVAGLLARHHLDAVPVVDGDRVVGVRRASEVGHRRPPTTAVILAGGRGSRLAPLTDKVPKPLLAIGGRTILERILVNLARAGITDVHLAVNYLAQVFEDRLGDGSAAGVSLTYLHEQEPLDTAGALSLLPGTPPGPVLVMNADQISSLPFDRLVEHHSRSGAGITVAAFEHAVAVPYGVLRLDGAAVAGIEEKPTLRMPCNAGIYVLDPEVLDLVPPATPYQMPALIGAAMAAGTAVGAFPIIERFIDIGTREELDKALLWFATGEEE